MMFMSPENKKKVKKISIQGLVVFKLKRFSKKTAPKDVWDIYKDEVDKLMAPKTEKSDYKDSTFDLYSWGKDYDLGKVSGDEK